jgi:putative inorganic carbon (HCO3(-)) transporter
MGFFFLLLYLTASYIRPAELYPWLAPYRPMLWLGLSGLIASLFSLMTGQRPTFRAKQIPLMAALMAIVAVSQVLQGWFGGALLAVQEFGITTTVFLLVVFNVTSLRRLRIVGVLLAVLSCAVVAPGVLAYHYGYSPERYLFKQRLDAPPGFDAEATDAEVLDGQPVLNRIRSLGFLNDPNDLAQALLVILPIIALAWRRRSWTRNLILVGLPCAWLLYGVYLTRSRGGLMGLGVLLFLVSKSRFKGTKAVIITGVALAALLALNFTGGREMSDGSGQGRLDAWSEGLQMLKQHPFFGVGYKNFGDVLVRTAHNSFVLCFAELGLVGYFVWLALLITTIREIGAVEKLGRDDPLERDLAKWARALKFSLYVFLTAAFFLSRTYSIMLFLLVGLGVVIVDLARREEKPLPQSSLRSLGALVGGFEIASVAAIYLLMRLNNLLGR